MGMARKARYEEYRHIIYYAAGKLELRRFDSAAAIRDYMKSIAASQADPDFRNRTYIELAGLAFDTEAYPMAKAYYDSADLSKIDPREAEGLQLRSLILAEIVFHLENIRIEDSLQKIALMPEPDREAYLKSLSKQLRKERGLKEEIAATGGAGVQNTALPGNQPPDLFTANASRSGEWYFYNTNLKSQGRRQFEGTWGTRPNQDNWRRMAAVKAQANAIAARQNESPEAPQAMAVSSKASPEDVSLSGLRANLPLTAEAMEQSRDTVEQSLYRLGTTFFNRLGNCGASITHYEALLNRFPDTRYQEEALFALTRCYQEAGNTAKASFYKGFLARNHSQGKYLKYLNNPAKLQEESKAFNTAATATYDEVYTLFIEGKFDQALARKRKADSLYGENYWSPQLLYIESVYYVRQRQDSLALSTLNKILVLYPQSNMNPKVAALMDVVSRREEIEQYLTNLDVQRSPEDSIIRVQEPVKPAPVVQAAPEPQRPRDRETVAPRPKDGAPPVTVAPPPKSRAADTASFKAPVQPPAPKKGYQFDPKTPHGVLLVLDKVDPVYVNEAKNALARYNREKFYQQALEVTPQQLTDEIRLVYVGAFPDAVAALDYLEKAKAASATEIFPWLPVGKYSYLLINPENLDLLKTDKNLDQYRQFLKQALPGKF
jgi:outer membrane protein assembly factor BamD (BamD/ComL family)